MSAQFILRPDTSRLSVLQNLHKQLDALPALRAWEVKIQAHVKTRSDKQLGALFGIAYKILREETGADVNDLHRDFCGDYFGWVEIEVLGKIHRRPFRTTTTNEHGKRDVISTVRATDFYAYVQRIALEYGIVVPDPDPYWKEAKAA